ncbi:FecR family protein [Xylophilus ampelinus]|uniref:FecR family protein n=1 Tax=Xylophilus ampelinus TaxID=54067 RepID=A0A318SLJ8_9BURK|nr:FecR domain-containing protein [Xylophilus ampelinus]MCS4510257.1 FecR domain-containing protein [Xylophilus ampelinus]PYE78122.1 FecR family protein [Xylophilus ampelinus]
MKITSLLSLVAVFAATAAGSAAAQHVRAGTAKVVGGAVMVQNARGERPLQSGDALNAADRIVTGADGSASVVLRDGSVMVIGPQSQMELKSFAFDSTTHDGNMGVSLLRGTMRMVTGLIGKKRPEAVQVETPTSTVGILGTDFIVEVAEAEAAK